MCGVLEMDRVKRLEEPGQQRSDIDLNTLRAKVVPRYSFGFILSLDIWGWSVVWC